MTYLNDIVVLFGVALVVLSLSHRLRIPPLVGFLLTGMLVGPSGLGWFRATRTSNSWRSSASSSCSS